MTLGAKDSFVAARISENQLGQLVKNDEKKINVSIKNSLEIKHLIKKKPLC